MRRVKRPNRFIFLLVFLSSCLIGLPTWAAEACRVPPPSGPWWPDERLDRAAEIHGLEVVGATERATHYGVRRAFAQAGVADATVRPFFAEGSASIADAMHAFAATSEASGDYFDHIGFWTRSTPECAVMLLLVRRLATLEGAESLSSDTLRLRGRVLKGRNPVAYVTRPDGQVTRKAALDGPGRWRIRMPAPAALGNYRFALVVTTDLGPEVALRFDTDLARRPPNRVPDIPNTVAAAQALVHRTRQSHGVGAVGSRPALSRAAQKHAQTVCEANLAAHNLGSLPNERARNEGFFGQVAENVAIATSVAEAHHQLAQSPSHRYAILDARATQMGIGIARNGDRWCMVQLYGWENEVE